MREKWANRRHESQPSKEGIVRSAHTCRVTARGFTTASPLAQHFPVSLTSHASPDFTALAALSERLVLASSCSLLSYHIVSEKDRLTKFTSVYQRTPLPHSASGIANCRGLSLCRTAAPSSSGRHALGRYGKSLHHDDSTVLIFISPQSCDAPLANGRLPHHKMLLLIGRPLTAGLPHLIILRLANPAACRPHLPSPACFIFLPMHGHHRLWLAPLLAWREHAPEQSGPGTVGVFFSISYPQLCISL